MSLPQVQIPPADALSFLRPGLVKARAEASPEAQAHVDAILSNLEALLRTSPGTLGDAYDESVDLLRRSAHGRFLLGGGPSPRSSGVSVHSASNSGAGLPRNMAVILPQPQQQSGQMQVKMPAGAPGEPTRSSAYLLNRWRQRVDDDLKRMQAGALID